jgi:hypothetical protein
MIFDFVISAIFGAIAHQTHKVTQEMPHGWQNLTEHTIGMTCMFLLWPHWYDRLSGFEHGKKRGWVALVLSALSFGIGNAAAWAMDEKG